MDVTRLRTQPQFFNEWFHSRFYPPGTFKTVIRPNFDTLYSIAWLDLRSGPVTIEAPITHGRYYSIHCLNMWTDSFVVAGSRTWGSASTQRMSIVGPQDAHKVQQGVHHTFQCSTSFAWVILRIQTNGEKEYSVVNKLQDAFRIRGTLVPKTGKLPKEVRGMPPLKAVRKMCARSIYNRAARLLDLHPPQHTDGSMMIMLKRFGMVQGAYSSFQFEGLPDALQSTLAAGMKQAWRKMRRFSLGSLSTVGCIFQNWAYMGMRTCGGLALLQLVLARYLQRKLSTCIQRRTCHRT